MKTKQINPQGHNAYQVVVELPDGREDVFMIRVRDGEIPLVDPDERFQELMFSGAEADVFSQTLFRELLAGFKSSTQGF